MQKFLVRFLQKSVQLLNVFAKDKKFQRRISWLQQRPGTQLRLKVHDFRASRTEGLRLPKAQPIAYIENIIAILSQL